MPDIDPSEVQRFGAIAPAQVQRLSSPGGPINPAEVQRVSAGDINPAEVQRVDLNAVGESGRTAWHEAVEAEIAAHPGLDKRGQRAVAAKWQQQAEATQVQGNPHYLGIGEEQGSGPANAFRTAVTGGALSVAGLVAPETAAELKGGLTTRFPYQPNLVNNVAAGAGGALLAAPVALTTGPAGLAVLGGAQGAGGARVDVAQRRAAGQEISGGQELAAATLHGVKGAAEGYLQGKVLRGAGSLASGIENPIVRGVATAGIDAAGNAAMAVPSVMLGNAINKATYAPETEITEGVGRAVQEGVGAGLGFAPMSIAHGNQVRRVQQQHERVNQVLGEPAALVDFPGGSDAAAMREVARAATGRDPVWFASESPRAAFYDKASGRMYVNVEAPALALHEAGHALFRGEIKPEVQSFVVEHPDLIAQAAENKIGQAENVGDVAYADKLRGSKAAREDEGFANVLQAAMTPEAIANIAATNPGAFMRGYERVLGLIDKITGGNRTAGRLVERQMKQFIEPLRANAEIAREAIGRDAAARTSGNIPDFIPGQVLSEQPVTEAPTPELAPNAGEKRSLMRGLVGGNPESAEGGFGDTPLAFGEMAGPQRLGRRAGAGTDTGRNPFELSPEDLAAIQATARGEREAQGEGVGQFAGNPNKATGVPDGAKADVQTSKPARFGPIGREIESDVVDPADVKRKPLYEMSYEELQHQHDLAKQYEGGELERVFGNPEDAAKYRKLERTANYSSDTEKASRAYDELRDMEDKLTADQQDMLFGRGKYERPSTADIKEFRQALDSIDDSSPQALGRSIARALTDIGQAEAPATMDGKQQQAYAQLRRASEITNEKGWNQAEVQTAAIRAAAARFSDPNDAEFMLRRWFQPEQAANLNVADVPNEVMKRLVGGGDIQGKTPADSMPVVEPGIKTSANEPAQRPDSTPRKAPVKPRRFTRSDLERRMIERFDQTEGAALEEQAAQDAAAEDEAGGAATVFQRDPRTKSGYPSDVENAFTRREFIELKRRRIIRLADPGKSILGADFSGSEDARSEIGGMGIDRFNDMLRRRLEGNNPGRLKQAIEAARRSDDPEMQLLAAIHENMPAAKDRGPTQIIDPSKKPPGTKFTLFGSEFEIIEDFDENGEGHTLLKDGVEYPVLPAEAIHEMPADRGSVKEGSWEPPERPPVKRPQKFYEPEAKPVEESKNIFGEFAPQKNTGSQAKMQYETEPVKVAPKAADETPAEKRSRAINADNPNQLKLGDEQAGVKFGESKVRGGRTFIEASAGDARLTIEQERPGGKTWRVVRSGKTIGEVSKNYRRVLGGGLSRAEAMAEAERLLGKEAAKKPPDEPPASLKDLPEEDLPFGHISRGSKPDPVAEAGANEEANAKAPLLKRMGGAIKRVLGNTRRYVTIDPVPVLRDAEVGDAAIAHASARIAAPWVVKDMIAKTLPEAHDDPKVSGELADILLKNRYLGAYDRAMANGETEKAKAIAQANNLDAFDKEVKAYWNDPQTKPNIDRYIESTGRTLNELYQEAKGAGDVEDFRAPRQGRYFDAYVPIIGELEGAEAAAREGEPLPANNVGNVNVRKDRFDRRASYTGTFGTDLQSLLEAVVRPRLNEVTKLRFYKELLAKGVAVEPSIENDKPAEIQGKPVAELTVDWPEFNPETKKTRIVRKPLFIRADAIREVRDVLDTDQRAPDNPIAKFLTQVQVAGIADAVAHGKNIFARLLMSQGKGSTAYDLGTANPVINIPMTLARLYKAWREVSADTPAVRSELAEMAQNGMLRAPHESSKFLARIADYTGWEWMKHLSSGELLHDMDTAARLIINRQYSRLVEQGRAPDTMEARRDFVLRLGNYNRRLMGPWMRTFRDGGFSPFIVAARNYNRSARELLTGNPGFSGDSGQQRINARLTQLGMLASVALTGPLLNMLTTGSPGGRDGTPTGAWDLGGDDAEGKHKVWDVMQMAGLRRGLRATGADAVIEGVRQGKDVNTIAGNALTGAANAALHPWIGPAPSFAFKTLTGRQLDTRGKMEAQTIPEGGALQYLENLRAATESQNPLLYALTRPGFQAAGLDHKTADEEKGFFGNLGATLTKIPAQAAGVKDVQPGKDAAADMAERLAKQRYGGSSMTPEDAGKFELRTSLLSKLRKDPSEGEAAIAAAVEEGKLSDREAANLHKKVGMSGLAWNFKSLSAEDAAKVYQAANDAEKEELRDTLVKKLAGSKDLSTGQQDQILEDLGIEAPADLPMQRELHQLNAKARAYSETRKKAEAGDRQARAKLSSLRLSAREQSRLSRLQNLNREINKARKTGGSQASQRVKRLVAAA